MRFNNEAEAVRYLFEDATKILIDSRVDFVVVGGWVPFLFHSKQYGHPGTFDVDVLLSPNSLDDGTFDVAAERLLGTGYLRAVKNRYQAHRILNVNNEDFVFHVDFLNERNIDNEIELVSGSGKLQSIYTPAMAAVFRYKGYRRLPEFENLRFPSVETFIVTKAAAAAVKKRHRDAFDIFITVADQNRDQLRGRWSKLVQTDGLFRDANDTLWKAINSGDAVAKIISVLTELQLDEIPKKDDIRACFEFLQKPT